MFHKIRESTSILSFDFHKGLSCCVEIMFMKLGELGERRRVQYRGFG